MRGTERQTMAGNADAVQRSLNINAKLGPRLEAAAQQKAILRIGWTNAGDPVPKNGELGLCPGLPQGARIRALGVLGSWVAAFGMGGSFTLQGDAGGFLGAGNNGTSIRCEQLAGDYVGFRMVDGDITVLEGVGHDAGAMMQGGRLVVRGPAGARVGGGMSDGLIVIHGDVGPDPGAGMAGGLIVVNGRCPSPPPGVMLRPLNAKEVKQINSDIGDESMHVPSDAVCLCAGPHATEVEGMGRMVSAGDLSSVGLTSHTQAALPTYATVDTVALVGNTDDVNALALPMPMIPHLPPGLERSSAEPSDTATGVMDRHPMLVHASPRNVDILVADEDNLSTLAKELPHSGGIAIDLDRLPAMTPEQLDGLLVAMKSLAQERAPTALIQGIGRVQSLHRSSVHHGVHLALARIEDGSGISEAAALPLIGRSSKEHLTGSSTQCGALLGFAATGHDLAVLLASGVGVVASEVPMADAEDVALWLSGTQTDLADELRRIGVASVDLLQRHHLRALDTETAAVSGLRLAGYGRPLPHWFAR